MGFEQWGARWIALLIGTMSKWRRGRRRGGKTYKLIEGVNALPLLARQSSPTTFQTVHKTQTVAGQLTETCVITFTPITDVNGQPAVEEVKTCSLAYDNPGGGVGDGGSAQIPTTSPTAGDTVPTSATDSTGGTSISVDPAPAPSNAPVSDSQSSTVDNQSSTVDTASSTVEPVAPSTDAAPSPTDAASSTDAAPSPTDAASSRDATPSPTDAAPSPTDAAPSTSDAASPATNVSATPTDAASSPTNAPEASTTDVGAPASTDATASPSTTAPPVSGIRANGVSTVSGTPTQTPQTSATLSQAGSVTPTPEVSGTPASDAAVSGASAAAAEEPSETAAAFELPGKTLSVLPIGLGVFAGISVIALIVVGLVTYERTKYRKVRLLPSLPKFNLTPRFQAFRQRKLAESGGAMGYGGMA
ncbi:hypothetical protein H0H81_009442 [Sphagnurus paluster]|uniref:Uncharacterized protein n=1 Tax=Sphagnurus paluster TaxID=117069 RepID=A0A9P7FVT2_9AGAR|nr:hypothetical protein H0H81_009442 [Sphagnurus paluster]